MIEKGRKMSNKYDTFNKVILYTIKDYIEKSIEDGLEPSPLHFRLLGATRVFKRENPINDDDREAMKPIRESEELQKIVSTHVSFLVYTLELIKQYVEQVPKEYRPLFNISDKKLIIGRGSFAIGMLQLKQRGAEKHAELTDIINDSIITAKHFFNFHLRELVDNKERVSA